jgi:IS30 family transposase
MTNDRTISRPWTPAEEEKLLALLEEGKTAAEIAVDINRTRQAIYARVQRHYRQRAQASRSDTKIE